MPEYIDTNVLEIRNKSFRRCGSKSVEILPNRKAVKFQNFNENTGLIFELTRSDANKHAQDIHTVD